MVKKKRDKVISEIEKDLNLIFNADLKNSSYHFTLDYSYEYDEKTFIFFIYIQNKLIKSLNITIRRFIYIIETNTINYNNRLIKYSEFIKWMEDNLFKWYIKSIFTYFLSNNLIINDNIEEVILKHINNDKFNITFNNLPDSIQEKYTYLINANKFDLI